MMDGGSLLVWLLLLMPVPVILARTYGPRVSTALVRRVGRANAARALMALAVGLVALGEWQLMAHREDVRGLVWVGAGAVCFWSAWRLRKPRAVPRSDEHKAVVLRPWLIAAAFVAAFWLGERIRPRLPDGPPGYAEQLGLWGLSVTLFLLGAVPKSEMMAAARTVRASWRARRREWWLVLGCMLVALALRFWRLEEALPVLFGDEASFARQATAVLKDEVILFGPGHLSHPWLYMAMIAPFTQMMGRTLAAVRMPSMIAGVLTVPAVYLLARELFDRWVAGAAAVFIAGWGVHVHFSRLGLNNIIDPLFGALAFWLMLRGLRRGESLSFVLAGLALGVSQYFSAGARLYPLVAAGYVVLLGAVRRWRELALMALAAVLVTFPMHYWLWANERPLTARPEHVLIFSARAYNKQISEWEAALQAGRPAAYLLGQIEGAFMGLVQRFDRSRFYAGDTAMLLPAASVALMLGILGALWRWRRRGPLLLLLLVGNTVVVGGALLVSPPQFTRYLVAAPALVILVALGLVWPLRTMVPGRWADRGALALAAALALGSAAHYFGPHVEALLDSLEPRAWEIRDIAQRARALPPETRVYVIHAGEIDSHAADVIGYMTGEHRVKYYTLNQRFTAGMPAGEHVVFVSQDAIMDVLAELPGGRFVPYLEPLPAGEPFLAYRVAVEGDS